MGAGSRVGDGLGGKMDRTTVGVGWGGRHMGQPLGGYGQAALARLEFQEVWLAM